MTKETLKKANKINDRINSLKDEIRKLIDFQDYGVSFCGEIAADNIKMRLDSDEVKSLIDIKKQKIHELEKELEGL